MTTARQNRFHRFFVICAVMLALVFVVGVSHDYFHPHERLDSPCLMHQAFSLPLLPGGGMLTVLFVLVFAPVVVSRLHRVFADFLPHFDVRGPPARLVSSLPF